MLSFGYLITDPCLGTELYSVNVLTINVFGSSTEIILHFYQQSVWMQDQSKTVAFSLVTLLSRRVSFHERGGQ